jgi:8-oxo-dGTP pyrophosphatase MutT (NUDIX family)
MKKKAVIKTLSAGVIVTDGAQLLLGHVTGSRHWDIPKGKVDPGESEIDGAVRELYEETSMVVDPAVLVGLGTFPYKRTKDLSLWLYRTDIMPDPKTLDCLSTFDSGKGAMKKEMDAFAVVSWDNARNYVIPDMWAVLEKVKALIDGKKA